jgi:hypothetical protein
MSELDRSDLVLRLGVIGAGLSASIGAIVGLIVGLLVYPPTAWFAILELGAPAAIVGAVGGLATGAVVKVGGRRLSSDPI